MPTTAKRELQMLMLQRPTQIIVNLMLALVALLAIIYWCEKVKANVLVNFSTQVLKNLFAFTTGTLIVTRTAKLKIS